MTLMSKGRKGTRRAGREERRKEGRGREGGRRDGYPEAKPNKTHNCNKSRDHSRKEKLHINPFHCIFSRVLSRW